MLLCSVFRINDTRDMACWSMISVRNTVLECDKGTCHYYVTRTVQDVVTCNYYITSYYINHGAVVSYYQFLPVIIQNVTYCVTLRA